mmetsp:Transcript_45468/g.89425  ORF Transcript_45468/g.89425 Transcript_45468/m.89425 type:complete len:501 (-) Transcript_45468:298-1800(-)|eukprot:CAMPEP_0175161890 /NCGR_PEP_ID=MMETSP0087-20121206/24854_1 /TAXON_ID=136419 /ORGANISM="Unknown Unknown, Strain D1" /LENGTH=500 /DNA_ID=CAMNT_0016450351 /DNA_START=50 /DNA_END=1552 /DNA_ORIENTATION=+
MSTSRSRVRKKREFSLAPPPPPPPPSSGSDEAVTAMGTPVPKTLAAKLAAASKIKNLINGSLTVKLVNKFEKEITINHSSFRFLLCKKATQDYIMKASGASISTRGRYIKPGTPSQETERPLYLYLAAANQTDLDEAVRLVNSILQGLIPTDLANSSQAPPPPPPPPSSAEEIKAPTPTPPVIVMPPAGTAVPTSPNTMKIYIGIAIDDDPAYPLQEKLTGPQGSYLAHITNATTAFAFLKGLGSETGGSEPLHILIMSQDPTVLQTAASLAENLVTTVRNEFHTLHPHHMASAPSAVDPPPQPTPPVYTNSEHYLSSYYHHEVPVASPAVAAPGLPPGLAAPPGLGSDNDTSQAATASYPSPVPPLSGAGLPLPGLGQASKADSFSELATAGPGGDAQKDIGSSQQDVPAQASQQFQSGPEADFTEYDHYQEVSTSPGNGISSKPVSLLPGKHCLAVTLCYARRTTGRVIEPTTTNNTTTRKRFFVVVVVVVVAIFGRS